MNDAVLWKAI